MKVKLPKISVIVPIYKVEPYLRKCLDSIVGQTYKNLEIILVDDGSPDNCPAICDEYAARDKRIKVIHKENGGVSSARNTGLAAACGEYIGWVDPDDWIEPDYYEMLLKGLQARNMDISICGLSSVPIVKTNWYPSHEEAIKELLYNNKICTSLVDKLFAAKLFQNITFPEGRTFEDLGTIYQVFERTSRIVCIPHPGYHRIVRPGSIMQDKSISNRYDWFCAAKYRYENMISTHPDLEPYLLKECLETYTRVFISIGCTAKDDLLQNKERINEMRSFFCEHCSDAYVCGFGLSGRFVLRLARHDNAFFSRIAYLINKNYEHFHGGFSI